MLIFQASLKKSYCTELVDFVTKLYYTSLDFLMQGINIFCRFIQYQHNFLKEDYKQPLPSLITLFLLFESSLTSKTDVFYCKLIMSN